MKPDPLLHAEKETRLALAGISVLRQIGEKLQLPVDPSLRDELVALARAQRRALKAVHRQLEADALLAHLLEGRSAYRRRDEHRSKSGKRVEELVRSSFFRAQAIGFRGEMEEWRALLAIFPTS